MANTGDLPVSTTLFTIGSSTPTATTTLFSINNVGSTTIGLFSTCSGSTALQTSAAGLIQCGAVSSDARLKEGSALPLLAKLTPITFHYKPDAKMGSQEEAGFIAQDVQKLFPDAVETVQSKTSLTPAGELDIKPNDLLPYIVKAIQQQQKEIENGTTIATRSAEENWQWLAIAALTMWSTILTIVVIRRRA
jgi:hypothetical protein